MAVGTEQRRFTAESSLRPSLSSARVRYCILTTSASVVRRSREKGTLDRWCTVKTVSKGKAGVLRFRVFISIFAARQKERDLGEA